MRTSSGREAKPATEPSKCSSCGADVLWTVWRESGKRMPVDAEPDMRPPPKGGTLALTLNGGPFGTLFVEGYRPEMGPKRNRYTSHFATCPNAEAHRRQS